ncbi:MAG: response regulator [Planctomycetota bacterium]
MTRRPRIAMIEDNEDNRLLGRALLEDRYDVIEFATGPDGLSGILAEPPDLVLLDISLPGMDGREVLDHLRADPRSATLPVVALTAHAMAGDREHLLKLGFDAYVSKPIVDEQDLLKTIERLLPGREGGLA